MHYIVKLFTTHVGAMPHYLGPRPTRASQKDPPLGVCDLVGATRFLWKDQAFEALKTFMAEHGGGNIVRGAVYLISETLVKESDVETQQEPAPVEVGEGHTLDIERGIALVDAYDDMGPDDREKHVMEARYAAADWFLGQSDLIFDLMREALKSRAELQQAQAKIDKIARERDEETLNELERIGEDLDRLYRTIDQRELPRVR